MDTVQDQDTETLQIKTFNPRGYGVAYFAKEGKAPIQVEIAHVIPGDKVLIEMRKKMKGIRKGRLLDVLEPSSHRVDTPCPHARVCGGCTWQQMDYQEQLQEKQRRVSQAFDHRYQTLPILAANQTFRYRNKMEFTFSENRAGQKYLGLMIAQAEPYVFDLSECHLCSPWMSQLLQIIRSWWEKTKLTAYHPHRDEGTLRYITIREAFRTSGKMAVLNISGRSEYAPKKEMLDLLVQMVTEIFPDMSLFLRIHQTKKGTPTQFYEMHLSGPSYIEEKLKVHEKTLSFHISPASFFQPNTFQAELLYKTAIDLIAPFQPKTVFDLYCGTGTLAMAAASIAEQVIGIELSPEAVLDAKENVKRNNIDNCTFYQGDVGKVISGLISNRDFQNPDVVIVDPPRAGLDQTAIGHLKILKPKAICYISCNPLTQAENVKELVQSGYRVAAVQPVDQFPHTYHIENIALLVR